MISGLMFYFNGPIIFPPAFGSMRIFKESG